MRLRYHGRRYRLNLFPMVVMLALLVAVISVLATSCNGGFSSAASSGSTASEPGRALPAGGEPQSGGAASSQESSLPPDSSADLSDSEPSSESDPASSDGILVGASSDESSSDEGSSETSDPEDPPVNLPVGELPAGSLSDWNLILLNPEEENRIESDLNVEKTKFDTQYVDSRAAPAYQEMCDAAAAEGITLYLRSGYRSIATQRTNYDANVQREISRGNNEAEAIRLTNLYYTVPGHSEHHTGLAFDIITPEYHRDVYTLSERFTETDAYRWLIAHCAEYGFVLRYPANKTDITKINFEPWHYRYVGKEHAAYMQANGLCLEEYIQLLKKENR